MMYVLMFLLGTFKIMPLTQNLTFKIHNDQSRDHPISKRKNTTTQFHKDFTLYELSRSIGYHKSYLIFLSSDNDVIDVNHKTYNFMSITLLFGFLSLSVLSIQHLRVIFSKLHTGVIHQCHRFSQNLAQNNAMTRKACM